MSKTAWEIVELARNPHRPTAKTLIDALFTNFIELHGDRTYHDDRSIIGGIALFENHPITVIATDKGTTTSDKIRVNFGMSHPEGYRKAKRLMLQAEKFKRPIFFIIDTPGAYPGIGAEERGQAWAIADNIATLSQLKTSTIALILSEGGSGGALALALCDQVWMCENAMYSILSPEGFSSILYKDASHAAEMAEHMKLTAAELLEYQLIDTIIPEVEAGCHTNPEVTLDAIKNHLEESLHALQQIPIAELIEARYQKYRQMGRFTEESTCQK